MMNKGLAWALLAASTYAASTQQPVDLFFAIDAPYYLAMVACANNFAKPNNIDTSTCSNIFQQTFFIKHFQPPTLSWPKIAAYFSLEQQLRYLILFMGVVAE